MQDKAFEVLDSMMNGLYGSDVKPTLTTFTACLVAALSNNDWKKVLEIDMLMRERNVKPSGTIVQGLLLANFREKKVDRAIEVMEEAIESGTSMDKATFMLCLKYMLPNVYCNGSVNLIRDEMRQLAANSSEAVAERAMELNKRLRDCMMEEQRQPSKAKNMFIMEKGREHQWRLALVEAINLSKLI